MIPLRPRPPFSLHDANTVTSAAALAQHYADLNAYYTWTRYYNLAYPGFDDISHAELAPLLTGQLLNNIGDPYDGGHGHDHTKDHEQEVVNYLADLFHAPASRWGYVTGGTSEGTDHALHDARLAFPDETPVVFASCAAHYSVGKAVNRHRLTLVQICTDETGRMDIGDLRAQLGRFRHRPAVVVATVGTTLTEAYDDVADIANVCDSLAISRRRIHVDAALSALPLALLADHDRPAVDFRAGATSIVTSGHKFLSTLTPCAALIYAQPPNAARTPAVPYTGTRDTTISGSRSGHTPLLLFSSLASRGTAGHRLRAEKSREIAADIVEKLRCAGWPAERGPHGFTVVFDQPPQTVLDKWVLGPDGRRVRIVCKPNTDPAAIDELIHDLKAAANGARVIPVPRPRHRPPVGLIAAEVTA
ncbi:pyridoxal-dependent decarboxylase [Actinoplanes sp. ATCC 53533]|uniref:pyridoxal-dependent decarboxylase n=1 Tax=Actinoplanes sp. ATCC 53533 TaxID=1288362 RepID=UPI000F798A82|nr:pyridoxal-dependent decarboxylase [Actinoplanes sp. ATCC 53533]